MEEVNRLLRTPSAVNALMSAYTRLSVFSECSAASIDGFAERSDRGGVRARVRVLVQRLMPPLQHFYSDELADELREILPPPSEYIVTQVINRHAEEIYPDQDGVKNLGWGKASESDSEAEAEAEAGAEENVKDQEEDETEAKSEEGGHKGEEKDNGEDADGNGDGDEEGKDEKEFYEEQEEDEQRIKVRMHRTE